MGDGAAPRRPDAGRDDVGVVPRFAKWASDKIAEDPDAKFAIVEAQSLAAHERPTQQHYKQLEAEGYNVVNLTAEKGVDFARQHFMPNTFVAGPDYLADQAKQDELLRVRAQQDNDAFCEKLYPTFAKEQALAMVPGAEKYVEFLGSRLEVIGGDVSSGTAALLQEKYGEQFGFKRFAIDNGLGPGYEEFAEQTNRRLTRRGASWRCRSSRLTACRPRARARAAC